MILIHMVSSMPDWFTNTMMIFLIIIMIMIIIGLGKFLYDDLFN